MGLLAWAMVGLAIWHFTIWLPDRHWGGIVGSLLGAIIGAVLIGLAIHGFEIPGRRATHLITTVEGIPGALIGIAVIYLIGDRRERAATGTSVGT
ncbi:hypothetical protein [Conexibacter sp. DBS9H8]|uniref:hypothetical protein n=1 Tax=Conexibacter sp. DBS9H8 TaxID=2937801 RepID=UPI00200FB219|nr:hypothetical protein [Conexibacter sp. DBS9H8]